MSLIVFVHLHLLLLAITCAVGARLDVGFLLHDYIRHVYQQSTVIGVSSCLTSHR